MLDARRIVFSLLGDAKARPTRWVLGGFLLGAAWLFLGVTEDILTGDPLTRVDRSIYFVLESWRTPRADIVLVALTEFGDAAVTVPVIIAVLAWLVLKRAWRPATYWLGTVAFAAVLNTLLKISVRAERPAELYEGYSAFSFPSGHASASAVMYGFLGVMLARELSGRTRHAALTLLALLVLAISGSRLYLGAHWLSDVIGGLTFATTWVAMLGLKYLGRPQPWIDAHKLALIVLVVLIGFGSWHIAGRHASDLERYAVRDRVVLIDEHAWWRSGWESTPALRQDLEGDYEQPFTFQWAGSLDALTRTLQKDGWREPVKMSVVNLRHFFGARPPAVEAPVLPKIHNGLRERLALVRAIDGEPLRRVVLRLWSAEIAVSSADRRVWIGTVTSELVHRPVPFVNVLRTAADYDEPRATLYNSLKGIPTRVVKRTADPGLKSETMRWDGRVLLAREPS